MPKIRCNITPIPGRCFHSNVGADHVPLKPGSSVSLVDSQGTRIGLAVAVEPSENDPKYQKFKESLDSGFGKTGAKFWKFVVKHVFETGDTSTNFSESTSFSERVDLCAPKDRWNTST